MRVVLATVAISLTALFFGSTASAHYGDVWFNTAKNTQGNIVHKYSYVYAARCTPAPGAHFLKRDSWGSGWYDHFICRVSTISARGHCNVTAHITGEGNRNMVLTSTRYDGCTSYDLWGN